MAQMLGVWTVINNPNRTTSQDLNLTVGGTILLTDADVKKLQKGELFKINIKIMDEDTFSPWRASAVTLALPSSTGPP